MNTPLIDTNILFTGGDDTHACCSCCEGYCPRDEGDVSDEWLGMYRLDIDGVAYLTDRYVAVRADACQPVPAGVPVTPTPAQKDTKGKGFIVPETRPGVTSSQITAWMWDRIDRAGLSVRGDIVGGLRVLHLYLGEGHVGWVMTATEGAGITLGELAAVRRVAAAAGISLHAADLAMRAVREG